MGQGGVDERGGGSIENNCTRATFWAWGAAQGGRQIDSGECTEALSINNDIGVAGDAGVDPVEDGAGVVVELGLCGAAGGVSEAGVVKRDDVGLEMGGEKLDAVDALSWTGAGASVAVEEDDDALGGAGEEMVEMRVGAVDEGWARREEVPAAEVVVGYDAG